MNQARPQSKPANAFFSVNTINTMVQEASALYQSGHGLQLKKAVLTVLDRRGYTSDSMPVERGALMSELCSRLGTRGAAKKKRLVAEGRLPRRPVQTSFRFPPLTTTPPSATR